MTKEESTLMMNEVNRLCYSRDSHMPGHTGEAEPGHLCEFKIRLVYIVSSKPVRTLEKVWKSMNTQEIGGIVERRRLSEEIYFDKSYLLIFPSRDFHLAIAKDILKSHSVQFRGLAGAGGLVGSS